MTRIKSSLTEFRVVPKTIPPQSQSNSSDPTKEPSEGGQETASNHEDSKLDQGNPELDQGNPELDQLILMAEEQ